ncbi:hypothetical protein EOT10_27810 [Streptomyces antnestii]|uniref:TauD/TfdA-like domain-containing protein n=2 Tax=Streptomyces antnestii TaxID=2494256 RepID=A0A3S2VDS8_9ACTN|nr:hypothetical protein EOT10_27810 [Streptomyces sp. San01]
MVSFANFYEREEETRKSYQAALSQFGYVHAVEVPDEFDHSSFLSRFGTFYPGPSRKLVDDIMPEPGMDDVYYGSNRKALLPHTEGYEFSGLPPRYLALWCVTPPVGPGGETTLFDTQPLLESLSLPERKDLQNRPFSWVSSAGLRRNGLGQEAKHPILGDINGSALLRFSLNNILIPEGSEYAMARSFLERIQRAFEGRHLAINYKRNDMVHWDNWRVLHSRNAFADPQRHLKRIQIRDLSDAREAMGHDR